MVYDNTQAVVASLEAEIVQLRAEIAALHQVAVVPERSAGPGDGRSRRDLLRLATGAAVGGTVALATGSSAAAAVANVETDKKNVSAAMTEISLETLTLHDNTHVLLVHDGLTTQFGFLGPIAPPATAAITGWGGINWTRDGVRGVCSLNGFGGSFRGNGSGATGLLTEGYRSTMRVASLGGSIDANFDRVPGEILYDDDGDLWLCVTAGNPGSWRKLGGPSTGGSYHAIDPARAYDSRSAKPLPGPIQAGASRTVHVRSGRDLTTGEVTVNDLVPAGATAVTFNLTVVNTINGGFLTVNAGGDTAVRSASINWSATGQVLANCLVGKLDGSRQLTVVCGGLDGTSTDFVLDVVGYYR